VIEVKAFGRANRGYDLWRETRQMEEARSNRDFYLYVVENVRQGDPALFTLRVLARDRLLTRLLERAKEQRYWRLGGCIVEADRPGGSPGVELEGCLLMS
jgi:hypothetical protein